MIEVIIQEMAKGNFSFAILIVGILQLLAMLRNNKKK
jgi:predicted Na+-dependent transporter